MELYLDEISKWFYTLSPLSIFTVFFFIAYIENLVPPLPGDLLVVYGGFLAAEDIVGVYSLLTVVTVASVMGFMTVYAIGNYWGHKIEKKRKASRLMKSAGLKYFDRGKRWMQNRGQGVILANRFLAGTRPVILLSAGIYRMNVSLTILNATISALVWNVLLITLGWVLHENWEVIGHYLNIYGWTILSIVFLVVTIRLAVNRYKSNRK